MRVLGFLRFGHKFLPRTKTLKHYNYPCYQHVNRSTFFRTTIYSVSKLQGICSILVTTLLSDTSLLRLKDKKYKVFSTCWTQKMESLKWKSSDSKQVVNFGVKEQNGMPSCTCKDWQQYHIPCKAVFEYRSKWQ